MSCLARDAAGLVAAVRADLGLTQAAFGALTGRSAGCIHRYERGWSCPPQIFFHDLIDAVPECGLAFNDVAAVVGYRRIESVDPTRYGSIHDYFLGVRVLGGLNRATFAAVLTAAPARIAAVEHRIKPRPYLVRRLALRALPAPFSHADVVRRFRTLRPSATDVRLRQSFRRLRDARTSERDRVQLRKQLIEEHADLARRLAGRAARGLVLASADAADAWTLALVKAVDGHDPRYGDFIPYLRRMVYYAVLKEAAARWQSGTAAALRSRATPVCQARDELRQRLRREPTVAEVAAHLGLPAPTVAGILAALAARQSVPLDPDAVEARPQTPATGFSAGMRRRLFRLDDHQRAVIELRFLHDLDLAEIADRIGVDQQTAQARLDTALRELRSPPARTGGA